MAGTRFKVRNRANGRSGATAGSCSGQIHSNDHADEESAVICDKMGWTMVATMRRVPEGTLVAALCAQGQ